MLKENELDYLVAMYGISYFTLKERGMLGKRAEPLKLKKHENDMKSQDAIAVYKWLAEKIKGISEHELKTRADKFNSFVRSFQDDYFLNQYLMGLFMLEAYLEDIGGLDRNLMIPKVTRLIKIMREGVININAEKGQAIVIDSSQAGSNLWRLFNGKVELTKELREAKRRMWAEAYRKKSNKNLENKYSLKAKK